MNLLVKMIICMLLMFGLCLEWKQWVIILYLKTVVLLLTDSFEKFIHMCLEYCKLDPCHYYFSSPGLSWDAMFKINKLELELISNTDMHLFIEKGMREGISYVA